MSYGNWESAFKSRVVPSSPEQAARLWNLNHEWRVNEPRGQFRGRIGTLYRRHRSRGSAAAQAAERAFQEATDETNALKSKWLGLLPGKAGAPVPSSVATYLHSTKIAKDNPALPLDPVRPPRRVTLTGPLKARRDPVSGWVPYTRFIWLTFGRGGRRPSRVDPTAVKRELGLDHFPPGSFVYRFELNLLDNQDCYIPTCLDAGLREAWKPPPMGFARPWGLTRNLTNGAPGWPELLVETDAYLSVTAPVGTLVSQRGAATPIRRVRCDYMARR